MELKVAWVLYRSSPSPPSSSEESSLSSSSESYSTILFWGMLVVVFWWMPFCCFQKIWKTANNLCPSSSETFSLLSKSMKVVDEQNHYLFCWVAMAINNLNSLLSPHSPNPFSCSTIDIYILIHSNVQWTIGCLRTRSDCFSDGWYFLMTIFCKCVGPHRIQIRKVPRLRKCRDMIELATELQEEKEYSIVM